MSKKVIQRMSDRDTSFLTDKQMYALEYQAIADNLRYLSGQVITVIEAALDGKKLEAVKSLVFEKFKSMDDDILKRCMDEEPRIEGKLTQKVKVPKDSDPADK